MSKDIITIALAGNPNCGKTTLFNALTGANLKVANYPGVTVERKEGYIKYNGRQYCVVDLPGTYSLNSYTMEEIVARDFILGDEVDVIIDVCDASSLERNLYLTLQLLELNKPVVVALNMMDIIEERGQEMDLHRLPEMLGAPTIPVSARKKRGINTLLHAVEHHIGHPLDATEHDHKEGSHIHNHHDDYTMVYSDDIEDKIDIVEQRLEKKYPDTVNKRWHAIKILENDENINGRFRIKTDDLETEKTERDIINQKYGFIEEVIGECILRKAKNDKLTDNLDKAFTHRIWGIPIFLCIMAVVFFLTFAVGDFLKGYLEKIVEIFAAYVRLGLAAINAGDMLTSLVVDGIIAGVGGILTFLPNIAILFIALALLEDSGYMSRVAYVMEGIMKKIGLSGRAFIPMILGFGCTVPAVMAARTLEHRGDKLKTIMVTPFMSCSARLPVYVLLSEMFFGRYAVFAAFSMYLIGLAVAIIAALVMKGAGGKNKQDNTLLIELPEYKTPNARTVSIYVWEKVKEYLTKAGTTIFMASVIIWLVLNIGPHGFVSDMADSFGGFIGKGLAYLLKPAGLGYWQIAVALISGIAAKEVVVSSMGVLFGISNIASGAGMTQLGGILSGMGFTAVNAYSLMLFVLLYVPCAATIVTIRKETGSRKWTAATVCLQLVTAWVVSTVFFQIASIF